MGQTPFNLLSARRRKRIGSRAWPNCCCWTALHCGARAVAGGQWAGEPVGIPRLGRRVPERGEARRILADIRLIIRNLVALLETGGDTSVRPRPPEYYHLACRLSACIATHARPPSATAGPSCCWHYCYPATLVLGPSHESHHRFRVRLPRASENESDSLQPAHKTFLPGRMHPRSLHHSCCSSSGAALLLGSEWLLLGREQHCPI